MSRHVGSPELSEWGRDGRSHGAPVVRILAIVLSLLLGPAAFASASAISYVVNLPDAPFEILAASVDLEQHRIIVVLRNRTGLTITRATIVGVLREFALETPHRMISESTALGPAETKRFEWRHDVLSLGPTAIVTFIPSVADVSGPDAAERGAGTRRTGHPDVRPRAPKVRESFFWRRVEWTPFQNVPLGDSPKASVDDFAPSSSVPRPGDARPQNAAAEPISNRMIRDFLRSSGFSARLEQLSRTAHDLASDLEPSGASLLSSGDLRSAGQRAYSAAVLGPAAETVFRRDLNATDLRLAGEWFRSREGVRVLEQEGLAQSLACEVEAEQTAYKDIPSDIPSRRLAILNLILERKNLAWLSASIEAGVTQQLGDFAAGELPAACEARVEKFRADARKTFFGQKQARLSFSIRYLACLYRRLDDTDLRILRLFLNSIPGQRLVAAEESATVAALNAAVCQLGN